LAILRLQLDNSLLNCHKQTERIEIITIILEPD